MTTTMKKWTQIEQLKVGDIVLRSPGLKAKPSEIEILSIQINGTYAIMTWKLKLATDSYYSTDFRKSTNYIDYGSWHSLTSQQWSLNK